MRRIFHAALAIAALGTYLGAALCFGDGGLGVSLRLSQLLLLALALFAAACAGLAALARRARVSEPRLRDLALGCAVTLASLLALDVGYSVYLNATALPVVDDERALWSDPNVWTREWMPRRYHPDAGPFALHKPGMRTQADSYGDLYYGGLERVPTLAREVLERRSISSAIDAFGFRDAGSLAAARIAALGDSYVFGVGVDQADTWVERLEPLLGQGVHNLGVSGSGPRAHLQLLRHLLETRPEAAGLRELLWLLFDGNDLEDPAGEGPPDFLAPPSRRQRLLHGTLAELLLELPERVASESVLGRLRAGGVSVRRFGGEGGYDPYTVDGQRIQVPLYRSQRLGPRLFFAPYIVRAGEDAAYVAQHPNRAALEASFAGMAELARERGLRVTLLLAASDARQIGPAFEHFPPVSSEPHFLDFVARLAREHGFGVIDLYRGLAPFAERESLFRRDDSHWNAQGNARVAEIVARELRGRAP